MRGSAHCNAGGLLAGRLAALHKASRRQLAAQRGGGPRRLPPGAVLERGQWRGDLMRYAGNMLWGIRGSAAAAAPRRWSCARLPDGIRPESERAAPETTRNARRLCLSRGHILALTKRTTDGQQLNKRHAMLAPPEPPHQIDAEGGTALEVRFGKMCGLSDLRWRVRGNAHDRPPLEVPNSPHPRDMGA